MEGMVLWGQNSEAHSSQFTPFTEPKQVPEAVIQAYQDGDENFKKVMAQRYKKIMKSPRVDPGAATAAAAAEVERSF